MAKDEPQSYGSQKEWVTGDTGQKVNKPAEGASPPPAGDAGGYVSDVQLAENAQPAGKAVDNIEPASRVTDAPGGARRGGFFKRRDYS